MNLWSRFFGRKPPGLPLEDHDDGVRWDAGDKAVCVTDDWFEPSAETPRSGEYFTVEGVEYSTLESPRYGARVKACWLYFFGKERPCESTGFRKVVSEIEAADAEFTALIKRPMRNPVKA